MAWNAAEYDRPSGLKRVYQVRAYVSSAPGFQWTFLDRAVTRSTAASDRPTRSQCVYLNPNLPGVASGLA